MKSKNEHSKLIKDKYESKFVEYSDIDEEEMNNHIIKKIRRTSNSSNITTIKFKCFATGFRCC